jgi:RimJ/RimL family protein N-acetyltransferase
VPEPLPTARLGLRELEPEDWPALQALQASAQTSRYLTTEPFTAEDSQAYIAADIAARSVDPRSVYEFAVTRLEDGGFIGRCGLKIRDAGLGDAGFWYVLDERCRGQGLMTEAARRLLDFAFADLGLRRLWADVDPRNRPSVRLAERLGLRQEAHFLEDVMIKGELCSTLIYAILRREWEAARP